MPARGAPAVLAVALAAALAPFGARAASFIGANLGQSSYSGGPVCFGSGPCDKTDSAWSVRAGYALPFVSVEARYFDLGRARGEQHFSADGASISIPSQFKASGLGAGAQAAVPIMPFLAVTALAGVSRVRARIEVSDVAVSGLGGTASAQLLGFSGTRTTTQPYYGLGLRFTFAPGFDASLDAQRYRADVGGGKADIDFYGVGLTYRY